MARVTSNSLLYVAPAVWTLALLVLLDLTPTTQSANVGFQGMDDTCILSFMVPRDKMKSSCELDSKVNRRINAMEMKVNIYKQQVADLHTQLEKQRVISRDKMDMLDRQVKESTVNADMSFLIERRLALLEKEFEQLHDDLAKVKGRPVTPGVATDKPGSFNTLDNNPVTLPNLVRSMVQSEVNSMMVNFTRQLESYVQDQILLYNRVFNMLPKPDDVSTKAGRTFSIDSSSSPAADSPFHDSSSRGDYEKNGDNRNAPNVKKDMKEELDKVKASLDNTGEKIAKHVGDSVRNLTTTTPPHTDLGDAPNVMNTNEDYELNMTSLLNETLGLGLENSTSELQLDLSDDLQDFNDSFSGDNPEASPVEGRERFSRVDKEIPVSSRMSHRGEEVKTGGSGVKDKEGQDRWKENMVRDQQSRQAAMEERLRAEIASMLYSPLAEVMSLMEKQMASHRHEAQEATSTLATQISALEQHVLSTAVKVDSLTKGFQDMREVVDTVHSLETVVSELQKNLTSGSLGGAMSVHELDEQVKKVKKLERLIGVYQHSLDHYRNETKLEYREIREEMERETKGMKRLSKEFETGVSTQVNSALAKLNNTYLDRFREIADQIRIHEDNAMLMQIDINNIDRKVSGKSSRSDKDFDDLRASIRQANNKHRDVRKRIESFEREQNALGEQINATVKDIFDLKTEVKLSVLDEWLPLNFVYDSSRTDCFGEQYVKRSPYKETRLVGVVLCNATQYKIFLSTSLQSTFLNIGDTDGLGEDHCEFVGAKETDRITLSPFSPTFSVVQGYARNFWGEAPQLDRLNAIKPSPRWYQCGVKIP